MSMDWNSDNAVGDAGPATDKVMMTEQGKNRLNRAVAHWRRRLQNAILRLPVRTAAHRAAWFDRCGADWPAEFAEPMR
jgi:hypothetical protein